MNAICQSLSAQVAPVSTAVLRNRPLLKAVTDQKILQVAKPIFASKSLLKAAIILVASITVLGIIIGATIYDIYRNIHPRPSTYTRPNRTPRLRPAPRPTPPQSNSNATANSSAATPSPAVQQVLDSRAQLPEVQTKMREILGEVNQATLGEAALVLEECASTLETVRTVDLVSPEQMVETLQEAKGKVEEAVATLNEILNPQFENVPELAGVWTEVLQGEQPLYHNFQNGLSRARAFADQVDLFCSAPRLAVENPTDEQRESQGVLEDKLKNAIILPTLLGGINIATQMHLNILEGNVYLRGKAF